jgi:predicted metal-dependent phosphoesterase TrpH
MMGKGFQMRIVNPFEHDGGWHKANLHCHTTLSDGEVSIEQRVQQYREKDYQILAITDHDQTSDVQGLSTEELLVVSGMETHPPCPGHYEHYHLVCLNVPHGFEMPQDADANARIALVRKAGGEAVLSHPYWSGLDINHLLAVRGNVAIEVYNATCSRFAKAFSSVHWDNLLERGRMIPAIAVDDTHRGRDIFMGWTMIKAEELSVPAMLEALRTGCYYSSCGPVIEDLRLRDGEVFVRCSPVAEVHFICSSWRGHSVYADGGEDLTGAEFALREGAGFIRVEVVDRRGRRAWTNPLLV